MIETLDPSSLAGSLAALFTGVASLTFFLRKKLASDNADIARNRAEENIILSLEKQRDFAFTEKEKLEKKLEAVELEKDQALIKVFKLTQEVENLSGQVKILRELVERLGKSLDSTREQLDNHMKENARLLSMIENRNNDNRH